MEPPITLKQNLNRKERPRSACKSASPVKRPATTYHHYSGHVPSKRFYYMQPSTKKITLFGAQKDFNRTSDFPCKKRSFSCVNKSSLSRNSPVKRTFISQIPFLSLLDTDHTLVLAAGQVSELYLAKCQDLRIHYIPSQEYRFHEYCRNYCKNRWISFKDIGLGANSAKVIAKLLRHNKRCAYLDLRKNPIGDAGAIELAKAIKDSRSLVHIDMSSNDLGPKGGIELFRALQTNQSVISLNLSSYEGLFRNRICELATKALIPVLTKNKFLTILNLSGNSIKLEGLGYLAKGLLKNNTLLSLKIDNNEIEGGDKCVEYFKAILTKSKVQELDISGNALGNECMVALSAILTGSGISIKRLYCSYVGIDSDCAKDVFENVKACAMLQTLRIGGNNFEDSAVIPAFQEIVGAYSYLKHLCLTDCALGDYAGQSIFSNLKANRLMRSISLQKNDLGILTAKALGELLQNPSIMLKAVDLSKNCIDDEGVTEIAKGLRRNTTLVGLNLAGNSIYNAGAQEILNAVKMNRVIERVVLSNNYSGDRLIQKINEKTCKNASERRRRKIPEYKHTIETIVVDNDLLNELEWECDQIQVEKAEVEKEIELQWKEFEEVKRVENSLYEDTKLRYEKLIEQAKEADEKWEEFEKFQRTITSQYESSIELLSKKLKLLKNNVNRTEFILERERAALNAKKQENEEVLLQLKREHEGLLRKTAKSKNAQRALQRQKEEVEEQKILLRNRKKSEDSYESAGSSKEVVVQELGLRPQSPGIKDRAIANTKPLSIEQQLIEINKATVKRTNKSIIKRSNKHIKRNKKPKLNKTCH